MWLIVAIMVWKYHGILLVAGAIYLWWKVWQHPDLGGRFRVWRRMRQLERQAIAQRCVDEAREYNEAGIYEGQYPAYTMPMTRPDWSSVIQPEWRE